jgi:hypothetical protein
LFKIPKTASSTASGLTIQKNLITNQLQQFIYLEPSIPSVLSEPERLDESLVALAMILPLELYDVIVLSSKVNGGLDDGGFDGTCVSRYNPPLLG